MGLLCETALLGKEGKNEGDLKREAVPAQNGQPAQPLRYEASTTLRYNFFAFATNGQPCWVQTTQREQHYTVDPSPTSPTLVKTEYSDGFGRLLQTRAQAEEVLFGDATFGDSGLPADPLAQNGPAVGVRNNDPVNVNVVVSGWQVYDNKGRAVEKYEPFFSTGFAFVLAEAAAKGQCVKMHYDPRGQVIRTLNPDGSEQRVIYGYPGAGGLGQLDDFVPSPWETYSYDANDLASLTHPGQGRADIAHAFTPQSSEIDALGRVIRIRDRLGSTAPAGSASEVLMQYAYDIRGNRVKAIDALGRIALTHIYDLKPQVKETESGADVLITNHLDGGQRGAIVDGGGQPLCGFDSKGALTLHIYDKLRRPTDIWVRDQSNEVVTRRQCLVYGIDPSMNINGRLSEQYDEAGYHHFIEYDLKGNLLEKSWQVVADEIFTVQWADADSKGWTNLPAGFNSYWDDITAISRLASRCYIMRTDYDALNRPIQLLLPAEPGRAEARSLLTPSYNRAGGLAQVKLDGQLIVQQVAYNARGQRLLLARPNGLLTRYTYDSRSSRLLRLRTEKYSLTGLVYTPQSGTTCQDSVYNYDLVGNLVSNHECAPQSGVGGVDELVRGFSYDALYRLLSANGRENQSTAARPWQDSTRSSGVQSTTAYTQNYQFDILGNIQQLRHVASNSVNSFTRQFDYSINNQLQSVQVGTSTVAYRYDAAGNVVQENNSRHYQWDAADQLRQFATWTGASSAPSLLTYYLYNGSRRVKKLTQTSADTWQVTVYVDAMFEHSYEVSNGNLSGQQTQIAVLDNEHILYQRRSGDALGDQRPDQLYAIEDRLGSTIAQTGVNGQLLSHEEYYPFGETSFGSYTKQRYRFCGKERDQETGMHYYGARYYAPWLCRFLSLDPQAAVLHIVSGYAFNFNSPTNLVDPNGEKPHPPQDKSLYSRVNRITGPTFLYVLNGANNFSMRALEQWGWSTNKNVFDSGAFKVRGLLGEAMATEKIAQGSFFTFDNRAVFVPAPNAIPEVIKSRTIRNGYSLKRPGQKDLDIDIYERTKGIAAVGAIYYNEQGSLYLEKFNLTPPGADLSTFNPKKGNAINFVYEVKTIEGGLYYTSAQLIKGMEQASRNAAAIRQATGGEFTVPVLIVDREAWLTGMKDKNVQAAYSRFAQQGQTDQRQAGRLILVDNLTKDALKITAELQRAVLQGSKPM